MTAPPLHPRAPAHASRRSLLAGTAALAAGGWVHVFPEGRVSFSGRLGPVRWGVGALACGCVAAGLIVSGGVLLLALIAGRYIAGRKDPQKNYAHVNVPIDTIDNGEIA
mgnify:CR=1 FL=1